MVGMDTVELSPDAALSRAQAVIEVIHENGELREAMSAAMRALKVEDENWTSAFSGDGYEGPSLEDIQRGAEEIRMAMVKSPIIDRGAQLRHSYTWSKGVKLPKTKPADYGNRRGPKSRLDRAHEAFLDDINQRNIFSDVAHEEMERALYSDGNFFLLGDIASRTLRRVPLKEIAGFISNPDHNDEVWAWKRTWNSVDADGNSATKSAWYFTTDCPTPRKNRPKKIRGVDVDESKEFLVHSVNRQVGWPLGIPDAIAIIAWAKLYSEFMKYGYIMNRALASIAFKSDPKTKTQGEKQALRLASATGAGQTAIGANVTPLNSAGKGYDFDAGRPIAAMVATGVQVSIVHLLSDPGAAGSSYSAAESLDLPTRRAIAARQKSWSLFLERVLRWIGIDEPVVTFPPLVDPDFYREMQSIILGWNSGTLHVSEVRMRLIELLDIVTDETDAPEGVMLPNNEKSWRRGDIDPKDGPAGSTSSTASPDQGRGNGAGNAPTAHSLSMSGFNDPQISEKLEQILELLNR